MHQSKPVDISLGHQTKLSITQTLGTKEERRQMKIIPHANGLVSIIYEMLYSIPNLAHDVVNMFITDVKRAHRETLK